MRQHLRQATQHSGTDDLESLQAAAAAGVGAAQKLLGKKFFFGEGVERDFREAEKRLNRAASRNEPGADKLLRRLDAFVLGATGLIRQHLQEASRRSSPSDLQFLCLAVAEGVGTAPMLLIEDYFTADGGERDVRQTAEWLSRAASCGLPGAKQLLREYLKCASKVASANTLGFLQVVAAEGVREAQELLATRMPPEDPSTLGQIKNPAKSGHPTADSKPAMKQSRTGKRKRTKNTSPKGRGRATPIGDGPLWPGSTGSADH